MDHPRDSCLDWTSARTLARKSVHHTGCPRATIPRSTSSMYVEGWNVHRVIRPARLANAVVERLLLRILEGEFPPGTDLPPEAALAAEFAVSRTILREALKALEEKR